MPEKSPLRGVVILSWSPQSAALLVMQRHPVAEGVQHAPFAPYGAYFAGGTGFVVTFASLVFALIPSERVADPTFFYITVFGTLAVLTSSA